MGHRTTAATVEVLTGLAMPPFVIPISEIKERDSFFESATCARLDRPVTLADKVAQMTRRDADQQCADGRSDPIVGTNPMAVR